MQIRRLATAGATAGLAAVLLAGCGGDEETTGEASSSSAAESGSESGATDQTGPEVASAAADALEEAGSVHVTGGTGAGAEAETVDLVMQGEDVSGTVTTGGLTLSLLRTGGVVYLQAPGDFWTASGVPAEVAGQLDGAWVVVPEEGTAGFEELTLATLVDQLRNPDTEIEDEVTTDELDGEEVLIVTQTDGSTLAVAAEGEPYPLQLENTDDGNQTLTLTEHGEQFDIVAPEAPIDLNTLQPGA
ncbi:hypothetical protein [Modestobacter roseus]|uniref:Lipoprotein LprG n=1 Tax=Modestobacter roseus TaxID=1181884 RepID=A0A562IUX7_9ACTN|nr:hypothetical protein [Modestobacter roseus]MQA33557.1 hypothetical protein [Modestobacter roseus]TWH74809.1 hypothetical protein JD78_03354 [Modestobacter roseus]